MSPGPFRPWRWGILAASGPLSLALGWLAGFAPGWVESGYARGLYPIFAGLQAGLFGRVPGSVFEGALLLGVLGLLAWALWSLRLRAPFWPKVGRGALRLVGLAGLLVALAMGLWGFNHRRQPLAQQLGWTLAPASVPELEALAVELREELVRAEAGLPRTPEGTLAPGADLGGAGEGYGRLPAHWAVHHTSQARPKGLRWPRLLSVTLTGGFFSPWTGEAHVNAELPVCDQPFTACHELAHQKGFAREDEANFLGHAAAVAHPDRRFAYSAHLAAFLEAVGRLPEPQRSSLLRDLPPGVVADLRARRAFVARHRHAVSRASQAVYAGYLRSQGTPDALRSYGRFLDLLLAQRRLRLAKG